MKNQNQKIRSNAIRLSVLFLLLIGSTAFAQQDAMFSQYMFNGLAINPAYAGTRNVLSTTALFRKQWVRIPGSPTTETFTVDGPFSRKKKGGLGLNLINDKIGVTNSLGIYGVYAYRVKIKRNKTLSFGLQAGVSQYRANFTSVSLTRDVANQYDAAYENNIKRWNANFGFGMYYYTKKFYAGLSIPHFIPGKLISKIKSSSNYYETFISDKDKAHQYAHAFLTAGYVIKIKKDIKLKPSVLVKYVYGAPIELDLNANVWFYDIVSAGLSFRTADAILVMFEVQANKQWRIGYSFDYSYTRLRKYNSGTHEIMLRYEFSYERAKLLTPRYF